MYILEHGGGVLGGGAQAERKTLQRREYLSCSLKDEQEFSRQTSEKGLFQGFWNYMSECVRCIYDGSKRCELTRVHGKQETKGRHHLRPWVFHALVSVNLMANLS